MTTAALTVLALVIPLLSQVRSPHWLSWLQHLHALWPGDLVVRGTFPFVIIAAGLWVLSWAERSRGLAVIAAIYTAAALLSSLYNIENVLFRLGWNPPRSDWSLTSLPNVLLPALGVFQRGRRVRGAAAPPDQDMSPAEDPQPKQPSQEHPTNGLDETVHQRHRLGILTITAEAQRAELGYLARPSA